MTAPAGLLAHFARRFPGIQHVKLVPTVAVALTATALACAKPSAPTAVVVLLQEVPDSTPTQWWGLSNIFFDTIPHALHDSLGLDPSWRALQLADIVQGPGLVTVYAARFLIPGSRDTQYVVDANSDRDLRDDPPLMFHRGNRLQVATFDILVRTTGGANRRIPYQVLVSNTGYTYARIADYRAGEAHVGNHDYAVRVRSSSRDSPFYQAAPGTRFFLDLSGEGTITEDAVATVPGGAVAAEEVEPHTPFLIGGQQYQVSDIDSAGSRLVLTPSAVRVAPAVGFEAPDVAVQLLGAHPFRLTDHRGSVILIEFWSVDCHYSEISRPRLNALAQSRDRAMTWLAVARERDPAILQRYLVDHPMDAAVAPFDSAAWATYDPAIATPVFYLLDPNGRVRLRAIGASAVDGVVATATGLTDSLADRSRTP